MTRLIKKLFSLFEDNPFGLLLVIFVFIAILSSPCKSVLVNFIPENVTNFILGSSIFIIIGVIGMMIAYYKEMPFLTVFIRGVPAVIIGTILAILSFGMIIWGVIYNFTSLIKP